MRKLTCGFLAATLLLTLLVGCGPAEVPTESEVPPAPAGTGSEAPHTPAETEAETPPAPLYTLDPSQLPEVTTNTNGFELYAVPAQYLFVESSRKGTVETIHYTAEVYSVEAKENLAPGSLTEEKTLYVYLPAGYTAEKQYNVLYLLHGSNETQDYWFYTEKGYSAYFRQIYGIASAQYAENRTVNMMDNLFADGVNDDFIIVTPSYYSSLRAADAYGSEREDMQFWHDEFEKELRQNIIPLVESKYSTYANGDVSVDGIKASRDHRALAGFSNGSRFISTVGLPQMLDVFSYFGSFHGSAEMTAGEVRTIIEASSDCPIHYWYNGFAVKDIMVKDQRALCEEILTSMTDVFADGVNFAAVEKPEGLHSYDSAILDLYNFSHVVFKGTSPDT